MLELLELETRIHMDQTLIARLCQRYHLCSLWLYGSVLRADFDPEASDVDVMIQISPEWADISVMALEEELTLALGRHADVVCAHRMNPHYVNEVIATGMALWTTKPSTQK